MLAGKVDRCNHIGHIHAVGDQGGSFLDHAVVDPDSLLVASITGTKHLSAYARYKLLDLHFLQSDWGGLLFHHMFSLSMLLCKRCTQRSTSRPHAEADVFATSVA